MQKHIRILSIVILIAIAFVLVPATFAQDAPEPMSVVELLQNETVVIETVEPIAHVEFKGGIRRIFDVMPRPADVPAAPNHFRRTLAADANEAMTVVSNEPMQIVIVDNTGNTVVNHTLNHDDTDGIIGESLTVTVDASMLKFGYTLVLAPTTSKATIINVNGLVVFNNTPSETPLAINAPVIPGAYTNVMTQPTRTVIVESSAAGQILIYKQDGELVYGPIPLNAPTSIGGTYTNRISPAALTDNSLIVVSVDGHTTNEDLAAVHSYIWPVEETEEAEEATVAPTPIIVNVTIGGTTVTPEAPRVNEPVVIDANPANNNSVNMNTSACAFVQNASGYATVGEYPVDISRSTENFTAVILANGQIENVADYNISPTYRCVDGATYFDVDDNIDISVVKGILDAMIGNRSAYANGETLVGHVYGEPGAEYTGSYINNGTFEIPDGFYVIQGVANIGGEDMSGVILVDSAAVTSVTFTGTLYEAQSAETLFNMGIDLAAATDMPLIWARSN